MDWRNPLNQVDQPEGEDNCEGGSHYYHHHPQSYNFDGGIIGFGQQQQQILRHALQNQPGVGIISSPPQTQPVNLSTSVPLFSGSGNYPNLTTMSQQQQQQNTYQYVHHPEGGPSMNASSSLPPTAPPPQRHQLGSITHIQGRTKVGEAFRFATSSPTFNIMSVPLKPRVITSLPMPSRSSRLTPNVVRVVSQEYTAVPLPSGDSVLRAKAKEMGKKQCSARGAVSLGQMIQLPSPASVGRLPPRPQLLYNPGSQDLQGMSNMMDRMPMVRPMYSSSSNERAVLSQRPASTTVSLNRNVSQQQSAASSIFSSMDLHQMKTLLGTSTSTKPQSPNSSETSTQLSTSTALPSFGSAFGGIGVGGNTIGETQCGGLLQEDEQTQFLPTTNNSVTGQGQSQFLPAANSATDQGQAQFLPSTNIALEQGHRKFVETSSHGQLNLNQFGNFPSSSVQVHVDRQQQTIPQLAIGIIEQQSHLSQSTANPLAVTGSGSEANTSVNTLSAISPTQKAKRKRRTRAEMEEFRRQKLMQAGSPPEAENESTAKQQRKPRQSRRKNKTDMRFPQDSIPTNLPQPSNSLDDTQIVDEFESSSAMATTSSNSKEDKMDDHDVTTVAMAGVQNPINDNEIQNLETAIEGVRIDEKKDVNLVDPVVIASNMTPEVRQAQRKGRGKDKSPRKRKGYMSNATFDEGSSEAVSVDSESNKAFPSPRRKVVVAAVASSKPVSQPILPSSSAATVPASISKSLRPRRKTKDKEDNANEANKTPSPVKVRQTKDEFNTWYPSLEEQKELYKNKSFIVEAFDASKSPSECILWRIRKFRGQVVLEKFVSFDMNGRRLHGIAKGEPVRYLDQMDETFFKRYYPVYTLVHCDTNKARIVQLIQLDKPIRPIAPYLLKIHGEYKEHIPYLEMLARLLFGSIVYDQDYLKKRVSEGSDQVDPVMKECWEKYHHLIHSRTTEFQEKCQLSPDFVTAFNMYPIVHFGRRNGLSQKCGNCLYRAGTSRIDFSGGPYDDYTCEAIEASELGPKERCICASCRPLMVLYRKLRHHKWHLYSSIKLYAHNLAKEWDEDDRYDPEEVVDMLLGDYEYLARLYLEFSTVLRDVENEIEIQSKTVTKPRRSTSRGHPLVDQTQFLEKPAEQINKTPVSVEPMRRITSENSVERMECP